MAAARLALLLMLASACRAEPAAWGSGATFPGTRTQWLAAADRAARDPYSWVPALAGLLVFASGRDEELAEDAREDTPVFGSPEYASRRSDELRNYLDGLWITSMLLAESGDRPWRNKAGGILVQVAAVDATLATSNLTKDLVDRQEPGQDDGNAQEDSFLSNHATGPFAHAALIRYNLPYSGLPSPVRWTLVASAYGLAAGTAWGRVEAGIHYPSDQLVGAGVGNFVSSTVNGALMGGRDYGARLSVHPTVGGAVLELGWRY